MATLTINTISGTTAEHAALTAADAGGDKFLAQTGVFIIANNAAVAARTITIAATHSCNQGVDHNITITIPASETWISPRISPYVYGDATGYIQVTYSDSGAGVTLNPFKLG
jgi:hypothetical protein